MAHYLPWYLSIKDIYVPSEDHRQMHSSEPQEQSGVVCLMSFSSHCTASASFACASTHAHTRTHTHMHVDTRAHTPDVLLCNSHL